MTHIPDGQTARQPQRQQQCFTAEDAEDAEDAERTVNRSAFDKTPAGAEDWPSWSPRQKPLRLTSASSASSAVKLPLLLPVRLPSGLAVDDAPFARRSGYVGPALKKLRGSPLVLSSVELDVRWQNTEFRSDDGKLGLASRWFF